MAPPSSSPPSQDEGVIKYQCHWQKGPALPLEVIAPLMEVRDRLHALGGIGVYGDGVSYGNISLRLPQGGFVISGSQTGYCPTTQPEHYSQVITWDISANHLQCLGPCQASSESLTHAVLYDCDPHIGAVIHIHDRPLWYHCQGILPTTPATVPYGTPAMAAEVMGLMNTTALPRLGVLVMAGHEEGLLAFGSTLAIAAQRVYDIRLCPS